MDGSVCISKPRYVRCPRCKNILQEDISVPVYQCGVCNTLLRAKHWKGGGQTCLPQQSVSDNRSKNSVSSLDTESITLSDNATSKTTDAESTSNSGNACPVSTENLESGANQNGTASEKINNTDENVKGNLSKDITQNSTDLEEVSSSSTHDEYHLNAVNSVYDGNNARDNQAFTCTSDQMKKNPCTEVSKKEDGDEATNYLGEHMKRNLSGDDSSNSIDLEKTSNCDDGWRVNIHNLQEKETMKVHGDEAVNFVTKLVEENLDLERDDPGEAKSEVKKDQLMESTCESTLPVEDVISNEDINNGTANLLMFPDDLTSLAYEGSISSFGDRGDDLDGLRYLPSLKKTFRVPDISEAKSGTSQWVEEMCPSQECFQEMTLDREPSDNLEQASRYDIYVNRRDISSVPDQLCTRKFENLESFSAQRITENNIEQSRMELLRKVDQLRYKILGSLDQRSEIYKTPQSNSSRRTQRPLGLGAPLFGIHEFEADAIEHPLSVLRSRRQRLPTKEVNNPYCLHCHALPPPGILFNNGVCTSCYRIFHHHFPSTADFDNHRALSSRHLGSSSSLSLDHEPVKKQRKANDRTIKRHLRPILGGANFIVCYECLKLLQIPEDLHVSKYKVNKVCCGICSKVITFSFSDDFNLMGGRQNQLCYTPSTGNSVVPRNHIDSTRDTDRRKEATLHRLMGYCSASDIIYQPSDEDEFF